MSAFRGILTGFGMAAIKDKEAKDNAKMEVVKAAGLDYHTNQLPAHKKMEANRASALEAQNTLEADKANADIAAKIATFDAELQFRTDSWNAANAQAVEQSNVEGRRQSNTINTAAQNAVNQQNAQNAFNMTSQAQQFLWQELRDQATFDFQRTENEAQRKVSIAIAALGNEGGSYQGKNWSTNLDSALSVLNRFTNTGTGG